MNGTQNNHQPSITGRFFRWLFRRQTQGRALIGLAALATLVMLFYLEEDWRGWHAWQKCKLDLEAKGYVLDWNKYIPPAVPDDQNFFKAPNMQEWFVGRGTTDLSKRLENPKTRSIGTTNSIKSEADARAYLQWSDQFAQDFNLIREALKRSGARMDGDYTRPFQIPIPNFIAVRAVAQTLGQRAHCYFLLNQPDRALDELTLMHDLRGVMQPPPSGRPITLVAAMINVAVAGLYASTIEEGFQKNVWQEPQLVALQKQTADTDLLPWVLDAFQTEPVAVCHSAEIIPPAEWANLGSARKATWKAKVGWWFWPRGWTYQNMVRVFSIEEKPLDVEMKGVSPKMLEQAFSDTDRSLGRKSPYNILAAIAIPNFLKANQVAAHNQTMVNEAQIACALERCRLANGSYPNSLDALVPRFIEKLPHDLIGGQPLVYRPTADGKFLLYSVGWNETDDGGKDSPPNQIGAVDYSKGDWVWKN